QFVLKGPRAESVCEVAPTQFQAPPSRRYVLGAGKSIFLNVISFFNPDKDEPSVKDTIKRLSYSDGRALQCVNWTEPGEYTLSAVLARLRPIHALKRANWTEPGEYTLSAVLSIGISPAPDQAQPFPKDKFAFPKVPDDIGVVRLESNT